MEESRARGQNRVNPTSSIRIDPLPRRQFFCFSSAFLRKDLRGHRQLLLNRTISGHRPTLTFHACTVSHRLAVAALHGYHFWGVVKCGPKNDGTTQPSCLVVQWLKIVTRAMRNCYLQYQVTILALEVGKGLRITATISNTATLA